MSANSSLKQQSPHLQDMNTAIIMRKVLHQFSYHEEKSKHFHQALHLRENASKHLFYSKLHHLTILENNSTVFKQNCRFLT